MSPLEANFTTISGILILFSIVFGITGQWKNRAAPDNTHVWEKSDTILASALLVFFSLRSILGPHTIPGYDILQLFLFVPVFYRFFIISLSIAKPEHRRPSIIKIGFLIIGAILLPHIFVYLATITGFISYIQQLFDAQPLQTSVLLLKDGSWNKALEIAFSSIIIAPVIEEVFFRGYLFLFVKKYSSPLFSGIMISLLFGLVHMSIIHFIPLALFGGILAYLYWWTNSIWPPIIAHAIFNGITVCNVLLFERPIQ